VREIIRVRGEVRSRRVWLDGVELDPAKSLKMFRHSPDGFNWGYHGSGPAQLALAILIELVDTGTAVRWYQSFKNGFIAKLPADRDFDAEIPVAWRLRIEAHRQIRNHQSNYAGGR
jgi:hypothetical protein